MKMKIVFFGASKFVIPIIELLMENFELILVITTEKKSSDAVPFFCNNKKVPFISVSEFNHEIVSTLKEKKTTTGVLAYFGMILPKEILDIFPRGIINIHPSLIPLYRGATPVQSAILNRERETGVTIIKLDEKMDHGPILAQEKESIFDNDTTESLHDRLFKKGAKMLIKVLPPYLSGDLIPRSQNDNDATYSIRSFTRNDGYFDFENPPSFEKLNSMIKAFYPWPSTWSKIKIKNAEVRIKLLPPANGGEEGESNNFCIQAEGKKPMTIKEFLNGYPELRDKINNFIKKTKDN